MSDDAHGFGHLIASSEGVEDSHWRSFVDVMMLIVIIFLLIMLAVVAANTQLTQNVRNSLMAQQKAQVQASLAQQKEHEAKQLAEFRLKENATLEEQLDYLQQRAASLEMELLKSKAETEEIRNANNARDAELGRLQTLTQEQTETLAQKDHVLVQLRDELAGRNTKTAELQNELDKSKTELADIRASASQRESETNELRKQAQASASRLSNLQGEFDDLDKKYQKLVRPARSPKNKQVAEVIYQKGGYSVRSPSAGSHRLVDKAALEAELSRLKAEYGTNLYVKIVIPESSGLSYNEAWRFTNEMLTKYDYYYQPDATNSTGSSDRSN